MDFATLFDEYNYKECIGKIARFCKPLVVRCIMGACKIILTKNIHVFKFDTSFATNYNSNGIKSITLYPNPNSGNFTVDISLYKLQTFAIFVFDALGNELLRLPYTKLNFISVPVNLIGKPPGTYLLKVIAEYDSKTKSFLITQ